MFRRIYFNLLYLFTRPPWDTGVSPPELYDFIENHEPGRAIDIGCGTGTNVITLAQAGWQVTGVDFAPASGRNYWYAMRQTCAGLAVPSTWRWTWVVFTGSGTKKRTISPSSSASWLPGDIG